MVFVGKNNGDIWKKMIHRVLPGVPGPPRGHPKGEREMYICVYNQKKVREGPGWPEGGPWVTPGLVEGVYLYVPPARGKKTEVRE